MLTDIFKKPKPILGKVQLLALPGAPGWDGNWESLMTRAEQEATALATGGVDGLLIENRHDIPYPQGRMDTAGAIAMALITRRIRQFTNLPVGLSVLRNDPETALAIALNTNAAFIRLPLLTGALVTENGVINSRFNELSHYQARLRTELPFLLVDVSLDHLVPAPVTRKPAETAAFQGSDNRSQLETLIHIAKTLPGDLENLAVVLSDKDIEATDLIAFKDTTGYEIFIENQTDARVAAGYFEQSDGLILEADLRKASALQPGIPPSIDMTRVEELVNTLRKVVPVTEMDPDIFLSR